MVSLCLFSETFSLDPFCLRRKLWNGMSIYCTSWGWMGHIGRREFNQRPYWERKERWKWATEHLHIIPVFLDSLREDDPRENWVFVSLRCCPVSCTRFRVELFPNFGYRRILLSHVHKLGQFCLLMALELGQNWQAASKYDGEVII